MMGQRRARRGSVAVQIGLLATVRVGFAALGTEVTLLLLRQRQMQSAADAAALSGAMVRAGDHPSDYAGEALAIAAAVGFRDGSDGTSVKVSAGAPGAVTVVITTSQTVAMLSLFMSGSVGIAARAVATAPPARLTE